MLLAISSSELLQQLSDYIMPLLLSKVLRNRSVHLEYQEKKIIPVKIIIIIIIIIVIINYYN